MTDLNFDMEDAQYLQHVNSQPTARLRLEAALRESRYVNLFFPPYSSGAGDMIDTLLEELLAEADSESNVSSITSLPVAPLAGTCDV